MKIAIFGISGRTGRPLFEQVLESGHDVTALVRDPAKISLKHERLRLVQGNATNSQVVYRAVVATPII